MSDRNDLGRVTERDHEAMRLQGIAINNANRLARSTRTRSFLADRTPRDERHNCPTCGVRYSWIILPLPPAEIPDDLPRIDGIPAQRFNCLLHPSLPPCL